MGNGGFIWGKVVAPVAIAAIIIGLYCGCGPQTNGKSSNGSSSNESSKLHLSAGTTINDLYEADLQQPVTETQGSLVNEVSIRVPELRQPAGSTITFDLVRNGTNATTSFQAAYMLDLTSTTVQLKGITYMPLTSNAGPTSSTAQTFDPPETLLDLTAQVGTPKSVTINITTLGGSAGATHPSTLQKSETQTLTMKTDSTSGTLFRFQIEDQTQEGTGTRLFYSHVIQNWYWERFTNGDLGLLAFATVNGTTTASDPSWTPTAGQTWIRDEIKNLNSAQEVFANSQ